MSKEKELMVALINGDIIFDSGADENIYPISKNGLPEIIDGWADIYPEVKEELASWKDIDINAESDLSKPIRSCTRKLIRGKKVLDVRLELYPTSNPEKINCAESGLEYEFKVYHNKDKNRLKKFIQKIDFLEVFDLAENVDEQHLENLIKEKENLEILFNLVTRNNGNNRLT
jgi:hypothetical protein